MMKKFIRLSFNKYFFETRIKMKFCTLKSEPKPKTSEGASTLPVYKIKVSNFDKRILVMFKYYNSVSEVPSAVSGATMNRARSQMRIRLANILIVFVLILCFIASWWGKKRSQRGESINKIMEARIGKF